LKYRTLAGERGKNRERKGFSFVSDAKENLVKQKKG
jgi:hypothetical protein